MGRYLVGPTWIHFCAEPTLFGVLLWGRPDRESVTQLVRSLEVELGPNAVPHESLVDASRIASAELEAFELLSHYVRRHHAGLAARVLRLALVRSEGMAGAVAAGFYQVLEAPYPVSIFGGAGEALGWLRPEAERDWIDRVSGELAAVQAQVAGIPPILGALRSVMAGDLRAIDLRGAARRFGLSERSLQRRLHELGTTFQQELIAVRLDEARRRMLDSDAPLTRIALEVGFTSLQHFSSQFRDSTGEAPSQWRTRRRV